MVINHLYLKLLTITPNFTYVVGPNDVGSDIEIMILQEVKHGTI